MIPTKTEKVKFNLILDSISNKKYKKELEIFGDAVRELSATVKNDNTLDLSYTVHIDYFERTSKCLNAILSMLRDPGIVFNVSIEELKHGKSLIFDVINRITEIQKIIKERNEFKKET
jgi:hypothetical protein